MENITNDMMPTQNKTKMLIKLLVLIVFVLVLVFLGLKFYKKSVAPGTPVITDKLPDNYHYQVIDYGKYPKDFPVKVIVNTKEVVGTWSRSEDTITADGKRFKILELVYKKNTGTTLAPMFEKSFSSEGWKLDIKKNVENPVVRFFEKTTNKITQTAILTIININNTDSLVNITISTK